MNYKLLFLDTETTGNGEQDRLMQVAYKFHGDQKCQVELFKPPLAISVDSMAVTHITNRMIEDKPIFVKHSMFNILEGLLSDESVVMIAHNAPFDVAMLRKEGLDPKKTIDTLRIARHMDPDGKIPRYNLQYLRYFLDLDVEITEPVQAHDAKGDVIVLEKLFERLQKKVQEEGGLNDEETIKKMIELTNTPVMIRMFTFGKHNGKLVADVAKEDRGYLEWLYKQKKESGDNDEDWLYTLEHFLK